MTRPATAASPTRSAAPTARTRFRSNGNASDDTNNAEGPERDRHQVKSAVTDQYADRHNPFIYFHSVTDNTSGSATSDVVPLGTATTAADGTVTYAGHLADDLKHAWTHAEFAFITPNLCDDGHDATCAGSTTRAPPRAAWSAPTTGSRRGCR